MGLHTKKKKKKEEGGLILWGGGVSVHKRSEGVKYGVKSKGKVGGSMNRRT